MSAATVHLISKNYDIVYSIDTDDDADFIRDVMARCLRAPSAPNAEPPQTVRVPVEKLEYICKLPDSYPVKAIISMVRDMLRAATGKENGNG